MMPAGMAAMTAIILFRQAKRLDLRAHRAVKDQDPALRCGIQGVRDEV